jgi:hypothetical protein
MTTAPYKWKILEQDLKPLIINLYRRIKSEEDRHTLHQDLDTLQKCEDLADATPPGQMQSSTDHNKNSTTD